MRRDVARYDATLLRDAVLPKFERMSLVQSRLLTTPFRAYLRDLASTAQCDAGLLGAVPTARTWRLAAIPRYLTQEDLERVIASCDPSTAVGVRDRAILLLLARLGLRVADVSGLRLEDIDWTRARLIVSGKSRMSSGLPLPQDIGDALLEYVERVRPRVDEAKVFLRIVGPPRPFKRSRAVTSVAQRALRRAGVGGSGPRGAHVFRHSVATGLLRSGATLEVVGALLRHRLPATTAIYAAYAPPLAGWPSPYFAECNGSGETYGHCDRSPRRADLSTTRGRPPACDELDRRQEGTLVALLDALCRPPDYADIWPPRYSGAEPVALGSA